MGTDIEVRTTVFDSDTLLVDIDMKNGSFVDDHFPFQSQVVRSSQLLLKNPLENDEK